MKLVSLECNCCFSRKFVSPQESGNTSRRRRLQVETILQKRELSKTKVNLRADEHSNKDYANIFYTNQTLKKHNYKHDEAVQNIIPMARPDSSSVSARFARRIAASKLLISNHNHRSLSFQVLAIIFLIGLISLSSRAESSSYQDQYQTPASVTTLNQDTSNLADNVEPVPDSSVPSVAASSGSVSSASTITTSTSSATCFGGLQTFEKISMSSFENPAGLSNGSGGGFNNAGFGSGILVQQDDQALTSECINLCRSQSNCLSFVIDYNKFECKSYATTQQELQQEFYAKFQAARATNNETVSDTNNNNNGGQYQQASASNVNNLVQQLLPSVSSNYFEKICLDGVANKQHFNDVCGSGRLWTIERVVDSYLDGFVEKEVTNVNGKDECSKLCLFETQFVCRSADYDQHSRVCRLSKEDRRTQPQAMRHVPNSQRQYLENQCATPGPSSCVYEQRKNVGIISMDALKFAQTAQDCQMKCNQELTFNCRSYSFHQQRCFLSGDDSVSLNSNLIKLPIKQGWTFGEKKCLVELCTKGIFSYEKITGFTLRSALSTSIDLMMPGGSNAQLQYAYSSGQVDTMIQQESSSVRTRHSLMTSGNNNSSRAANLVSAMMNMMMPSSSSDHTLDQSQDDMQESASSRRTRSSNSQSSNLAITEHCRHSCDLGYLNCPAFTIDYRNNRCQRLDRNSQGRHHELVAKDAFAYYEKICLRVPEIMSMCQDKYWIFERVIGYELAPRLYEKSLKFVQSRRDCQEYCLEEKQFQCRSALYNDETSDCKLSAYDRRLALAEGGYYRNFNVRISYLENNCIRDHDINRQQCSYEQTRDEPAYPTFTERIEMVATNNKSSHSNLLSASYANLPQPSELPAAEVSSKIINMQQASGAAHCEQLCNDNARFECHSFGYYASTSQCFLSGDDSISAGEMATTPANGFVYFERKCRLNSATGLNQTDSDQDSARMPLPTIGSGPSQPPATPASVNPYFPQPTSTGTPNMGPLRPNPDPMMTTTPSSANNQNFSPSTTTMSPINTTTPTEADDYKCGLGHTFVYQRIAGFEPIGGYLTLLLKNNEQPGIVNECANLCRLAFECRAFVVDYSSNQCYAMLENSSVGLLSLRQTLGKDYFEGFCLANHLLSLTPGPGTAKHMSCRQKSWLVDKIVDQAVVGVQHQRVIADSSRAQCRQACLEESLFLCKSSMFESASSECKLYSVERESTPQMRLLFTKGVDFFENQCQISSQQCPYDAIERDQTHITVTKSIQARSIFDCELACNLESSFNCRSYTYLDQYPGLPNLCLLSSDSRSTSQRGSIRELHKALYAERNCFYRRPRIPGLTSPANSSPMMHNDLLPPALSSPSRPTFDPYGSGGSGIGGSSLANQHHHSSPEQDETSTNSNGQADNLDLSNLDDLIGGHPALGQAQCEPHQFTFERTFGYDFKLAQKERAPIAPTIGIAIGCQQECLRRADRCQAFVIDYALPYQSCFLLETQVGANKRNLVRAPSSAYFEKVCLPRTGVQPEQVLPSGAAGSGSLTHSSMSSSAAASNEFSLAPSLDISPSYSHEPWTPQLPNQLPYYLQQQQLAQHYPSRSCPKLWSFERFVNHNFTAPVDKILTDSLSRTHCETACINEASFACRSATYDYSQKICRLFRNTRRTILSQFVDLSSPSASDNVPASTSTSSSSHPGTAQVLSPELPQSSSETTLQTSASALTATLSSQAGRPSQFGKQLNLQTAEPSSSTKNIDYLENTCTPEPSSCQYRQIYDQFSPYIDKVLHATSLADCQRQCDQERLFSCKSLNYDPHSRNCMLVNEDLLSLQSSRGGSGSVLLPKKGTIYSEKGNCEMISVQCNSQAMLVMLNFDTPFRGRIMAKGNPEQCFQLGDGQTSLQFPIVFGPKCNSRQEGHNTFVNELIIQQHPVIMTDNDKTIRVMCAFDAPDQTITLKPSSAHSMGSSVNGSGSGQSQRVGIDVAGTPETSRTRHDKQHFNSVVSSKAAPPSVVLRILEAQSGRDASMINLGDDLLLRIQMQLDNQGQPQQSALGIFARNLAARSSNGESLLLIDNNGCPVDPQVFPALEIDPRDGRSLQSQFKAFRFPSSGLVNFEVQIRFCPEKCQPVDCHKGQSRSQSFGKRRRKRDLTTSGKHVPILQSGTKQTSIVDSFLASKQSPVQLESLSTVMKPGKAFEYVRKLLLTPPSSPGDQNYDSNNEPTSGQTNGLAQNENEQSQPNSSQSQSTSEEFDNGTPASSDGREQAFSPRENETGSDGFSPMASTQTPMTQADAKPYSTSSSIQSAPYDGRFPMVGLNDEVRSDQQAAGTQETLGPAQESATQATFDTQTENHDAMSNGDNQQPNQHDLNLKTNNNELPLRFSILVGENTNTQGQSIENAGGFERARDQQVRVMNSSNIDLDHIVIAGNGQQALSKTTGELAGDNYMDQRQLQQRRSAAESSSNASPSSYVDAVLQSSSSPVSSEVKLSSAASPSEQLGTAASQRQQPETTVNCHLEQAARNKLKTIIWTGGLVIALNICLVVVSLFLYFKRVHLRHFDTHTFHSTSGSALAATSSDLSGNYSATSLTREQRRPASSDSRRRCWPSLFQLFGSTKNRRANLAEFGERPIAGPGSTSLSAHEHFFCRLNSTKQSLDQDGTAHFNWPPNLSSSSTHSTVSSLASPLPAQVASPSLSSTLTTSCARVQGLRRPSLSSMQDGNFQTFAEGGEQQQQLHSIHRTILDIGHQQQHQRSATVQDKYNARYTNNIDRYN